MKELTFAEKRECLIEAIATLGDKEIIGYIVNQATVSQVDTWFDYVVDILEWTTEHIESLQKSGKLGTIKE